MSKGPRAVIETCRSIENLCLDPYWTSGNRWKIEVLARELRMEVERITQRIEREKNAEERLEELIADQLSEEFQLTGGFNHP